MRIKNSFDAADMALCRAHSEEVRRDMDERQDLTQEFPATELLAFLIVRAFEVGAHMPTDAPLPPSYWDDMEEMWPSVPQAPTGDAYVSAKQPDQADVWHSEPPAVAGVYETRPLGAAAYSARERWWDGSAWHSNHSSMEPTMEQVRTTGVRPESLYGPLLWLRLIEADKPAETAAPAAAEYSVCIKAHGMAEWLVGDVQPGSPDTFAHPGNWLPCDKDGWVSHTPTADSVCPVPEGVEAEIQFENGCFVQLSNLLDIDGYAPWDVKKAGRAAAFVFHSELGYGAISAWRPTGATA